MMDMVFNLMWMMLGALLGAVVMALASIASNERDDRR